METRLTWHQLAITLIPSLKLFYNVFNWRTLVTPDKQHLYRRGNNQLSVQRRRCMLNTVVQITLLSLRYVSGWSSEWPLSSQYTSTGKCCCELPGSWPRAATSQGTLISYPIHVWCWLLSYYFPRLNLCLCVRPVPWLQLWSNLGFAIHLILVCFIILLRVTGEWSRFYLGFQSLSIFLC